MRRFAILVLALTAGCNEAPVPQPQEVAPPVIAAPVPEKLEKSGMNEHSKKLANLPESERLDFIGTAVKSSGIKCNAERVMFNGSTSDGQDFWSVDCGDTDQILSIKASSETKTLDCAVMAQFDTPCWQEWPS